MTTMENLPYEVLSEIFIRLLAKQLAQMRSVCKSWNALLSDSSFIKSHRHHSINKKDGILLFFDMKFKLELNSKPFTALPSHSPDLELINFIKPPVIPECKYGYGFVIGSVNGLICFCYKSYHDYDYVVHIWNPPLSALFTLPPSSFPTCFLHFGFGYDPKTDDYKVLKLTSFSRTTNMVPQGEVYSLIKGSWKLISSQTFPSHITFLGSNRQVCVDDNLHLLCDTDLHRKRETIVAFDLCEEAFIEIPLPETIVDFNVYKGFNVLGVLGGKLCVMSRDVRDGRKWEVWVMDEYGVPESWVKHHAFSQLSGDIIPCGFTSHNEFLFKAGINDDRCGLYDLVAAKTKTFKIIFRNSSFSKFVEYVDSLVWIQPANHELSGCDISQLQIGK